jgi:hypothetical protein
MVQVPAGVRHGRTAVGIPDYKLPHSASVIKQVDRPQPSLWQVAGALATRADGMPATC